LKVAVSAGMPYIVTALEAEGNAAGEVAAEPAAHDARAELSARGLELGARLAFLRTVGALHGHWTSLLVNARHSFVLAQLLSFKEVGELLLPSHCLRARALLL